MVDRGIRFDDAQREFEKHFIAHVVTKHQGNLGQGRRDARCASQYADAEDSGTEDQG